MAEVHTDSASSSLPILPKAKAKPRRASIDTIDLFHAHIGGMDTFAHGLLIAQKIIDDGLFDQFISTRYKSFSDGFGKQIMAGGVTLEDAEKWIDEMIRKP